MSNKFPLPLVSMTAMGVYVITGCLAPADASRLMCHLLLPHAPVG